MIRQARTTAVGLLACAGILASGCRAGTPVFDEGPEHRYAAVVIGSRIVLPTGETNTGGLMLDLEGEGGREANSYRLEVPAGRSMLFPVEPGVYRLTPTRSVLQFAPSTKRCA